MKKIFFVIQSLSCGGAERVVSILANEFSRREYKVYVVCFYDETKDFYKLNDKVIKINLNLNESKGILSKIVSNIKRILKLRKLIKKEKPDITVSFMEVPSVILILSSFLLGNKVVVSERTNPEKHKIDIVVFLLRKYLYRFVSAVVVLTEGAKNWFEKHTFSKNVAVIPNPVLVSDSDITENDKLLDEIKKSGKRIILSVGRLSYEKGQDIMLRAYSKISDKVKDWVIVFVGDGPFKDELKKLVSEYNIKEKVYFAGRKENVGIWYKNSDIFVLSSRYEGFPNALIEAMAYGCACVSLNCKFGPSDIIVDVFNGILVDGDVNELANALLRLINDEDLRKKISENAVEIKNKYSVDNIVKKWEDLFNKISP